MASDEKTILPADSVEPNRRWSKRRKIIVISSIMGVIVTALVVGLSVGLTVGRPPPPWRGGNGSPSAPNPPTSTPTTSPGSGSQTPGSIWQPPVGMKWQYNIRGEVTDISLEDVNVYDIDLADNSAQIISNIHEKNTDNRVICYFSAGSSEDWREDNSQFEDGDMGDGLDGWAGERWLKTSSPNVRRIMEARLDMAKEKGCDGVEPDNVDGYSNENGLGLTKEGAIDYMKFLSKAAHDRNLAIGLKNAGGIIPDVIDHVQYSVNEQCHLYNECETFQAFIEQGKPVFHVEYPKGDEDNDNNTVASTEAEQICDDGSSHQFSTILKNMDLDTWIQPCPKS